MSMLEVKIEHMSWEWVAEFGPKVVWEADKKKTGLIQMQNGYGKTTTLKLMQHIFANDIPDSEMIEKHLQPKGPDAMEKTDENYQFTGPKGKFEVGLSINGKKYSIGIDIFHSTHEAEFYTVGPKGRERGWLPPDEFKVFEGNMELCRLFLFDAEIASEINNQIGKKTVQEAIMKMANLSPVQDLIEANNGTLDTYISEKIAASKLTEDAQRQLNQVDTIIGKAQTRKSELEDRSTKTTGLITKLGEEKEKLLNDVEEFEADRDTEGIISELKDQRTALITQRNERSKELARKLINPSNLSESHWEEVKQLFVKLKGMGIPATGKQILRDVLEDGTCICGEEIEADGDREKHINQHIEEMLEEAHSGVVFSIRTDVNTIVQDSLVDTEIEGLRGFVTEIGTKGTAIQRAKKKLTRGDVEGQSIEDMEKRIEEIEKIGLPLLQQDLEATTSKNLDNIKANNWADRAINKSGEFAQTADLITTSDNIFVIEKCIQRLQTKKSKLADLADRQEAVNKLSECIEKALDTVESNVKEEIRTRANDRLAIMHPQGGLQIESLENGMTLKNIVGRQQEGANAAATLVISYSFVTALLQVADTKVPIVFDSPVNPFGAAASNQFVRFVANQLDSQSIHFIQSNERRTYNYLHDNKPSEISRCTIWRPDENWKEDENGNLRYSAAQSLKINNDVDFYMKYDPVM